MRRRLSYRWPQPSCPLVRGDVRTKSARPVRVTAVIYDCQAVAAGVAIGVGIEVVVTRRIEEPRWCLQRPAPSDREQSGHVACARRPGLQCSRKNRNLQVYNRGGVPIDNQFGYGSGTVCCECERVRRIDISLIGHAALYSSAVFPLSAAIVERLAADRTGYGPRNRTMQHTRCVNVGTACAAVPISSRNGPAALF